MRIIKIIVLLAVIAFYTLLIYKFFIYDKKQKIEITKQVSNGTTYEEYITITNQSDVKEIRRIIDDTTWEPATNKPSRLADYVFVFQYVNPNIQAKSISYQVWISTDNDQIELYRDTNEYSLVSKDDTLSFLNILIP